MTVLARIDTALRTLRTQAATFGTKLGTVETRQNFTKSLIQTLETGADNLVLADTNEEGANMLALQTRQSSVHDRPVAVCARPIRRCCACSAKPRLRLSADFSTAGATPPFLFTRH